VSQVVHTQREVDAGFSDGGSPETRVERAARERVPVGDLSGGEEQVVAAEPEVGDPGGESVEQVLGDVQSARFVVFGVGLDDHALAGGGVLLGDLDDRLGDRDGAAQGIDVPGAQRYQFAPAQPGLDVGEHQRLEPWGDGDDDGLELRRGEDAVLLSAA